MSPGLLYVRLYYPDLLHLACPSGYLLTPKGRRAGIQVTRRCVRLQLTDLTNSMVPKKDGLSAFVPHHEITSTYQSALHLEVALVSQAELDRALDEFAKTDGINPQLPHLVTFDIHKNGLYRAFETRYATVLTICYEVQDTNAVVPDDKQFFTTVLDEFVHVYRNLSGDYRPRLFEDCREPMLIRFATIAYTASELDKPPDQRLAAKRELRFDQSSHKASYDRQPFTEVPADETTNRIRRFLSDAGQVTPAQEFLSMARHAAFHTKNFKYAVLEAFISVETLVVDYLIRVKLQRGVSKSKLDDYASEITISYMLNVELPMLVDNITAKERQILGNVDRVRDIRNDIVHEGKIATEQDAQFAVKAAEELHVAMRRWAS